MKSYTLISLAALALFGCSSNDDTEQVAWADEKGAVGDPSGTISGQTGGLSFIAELDQAGFRESMSSFQMHGRWDSDTDENYVMIGLSIDNDLMGVGSFNCEELGEADVSIGTLQPDSFGGYQHKFFQAAGSGYPCTITIDSFGNVGEAITGSFSGSVVSSDGYMLDIFGDIDAIRGSVMLNEN